MPAHFVYLCLGFGLMRHGMIMLFRCYYILICKLFMVLFPMAALLSSCSNKPRPEVAFYYWKSRVKLGPTEKEVLTDNAVKKIYLRYFDVDIDPVTGQPVPVAIVKGDSLQPFSITPVVFIKNRVFEKLSYKEVDTLTQRIAGLTARLNQKFGINPEEMQFDCDWTVKTKECYFYFLKRYRAITKQNLSATIRLHQVKYPDKTGIPPVGKGVLMYYNMGRIDAGNRCSIYDRAVAQRYTTSIKSYPLPLDIALPIFTWGIQIRQNGVVHLLNKMNESHFANNNHFKKITENRYRVTAPCFKGGYYFLLGDEVKIETISDHDLHEMVKDISKSISVQPQKLIFYDLDSINIKQYEIKIYQKMASCMR